MTKVNWTPVGTGESEQAKIGDYVLRVWRHPSGREFMYSLYYKGHRVIVSSASTLDEAKAKAEGALEDDQIGGALN
jgi:hypothetical protein